MTLTLSENYKEDFKVMEPHGFVCLEAVGGDDLTIVNAARASFDQQSHRHFNWCPSTFSDDACDCANPSGYRDNPPLELSKRDRGLIGFLIREGHTSPTEQVEIWLRLRMPIFVTRQWQRHRMAEMNEESARYSKLKDEFWLPTANAVRTQVGKPGNYSFEPMDDETAQYVIDRMEGQCEAALATYRELLDLNVAKEVARAVLPVSMYSTMVWKVNLHSLMHFLLLRNDSHAQREIREYAEVIENMVRPYLPVTMQAFDKKYGRGEFAPAARIPDNADGSCGSCGVREGGEHRIDCVNFAANLQDSMRNA